MLSCAIPLMLIKAIVGIHFMIFIHKMISDSCVPPFWIGDRQFTAEDLALIETIVREFKQLSRSELAATVCENLPWKAPNEKLKKSSTVSPLLLPSSVLQ